MSKQSLEGNKKKLCIDLNCPGAVMVISGSTYIKMNLRLLSIFYYPHHASGRSSSTL